MGPPGNKSSASPWRNAPESIEGKSTGSFRYRLPSISTISGWRMSILEVYVSRGISPLRGRILFSAIDYAISPVVLATFRGTRV